MSVVWHRHLCSTESTPPAASSTEPGAGTHLPKCPQQNSCMQQTLKITAKEEYTVWAISPQQSLARAGKKGKLWMSESKGSLIFCREQGNIQSKQNDWQVFSKCEILLKKKNIGSRNWLVFGTSYSNCSVLFLNIAVTDSFSLLILQELNSVHVTGH